MLNELIVFGLLPTLPTLDIVCCVLCCAYAFAKLCVCWGGGGGGHMRIHASSVLVAMSVSVMHTPTHCDNLFFYVLPIQSLQARTICVLGYNHSRLERSS